MKEITKRTITGAVYVLSVIVAVCFNRYIAAAYFAIVAALGLKEFLSIAKQNGIKLNQPMVYLCATLLYCSVAASCFPLDLVCEQWFLICNVLRLAFFAAVLCLIIASLYTQTDKPFTSLAYSLTSLAYVVFPLALSNVLFDVGAAGGFNLLLAVFVFAWCNDTFAYLVGCKFGKHRLFERHSPKKSWEGFFGGLAATLLAAGVVFWIEGGNLLFWHLIALIVSIVGTFGDLVESMFKRQMGVKDSGNILPGHGGILDRFDILLTVLPAVWIVVELFTMITWKMIY